MPIQKLKIERERGLKGQWGELKNDVDMLFPCSRAFSVKGGRAAILFHSTSIPIL